MQLNISTKIEISYGITTNCKPYVQIRYYILAENNFLPEIIHYPDFKLCGDYLTREWGDLIEIENETYRFVKETWAFHDWSICRSKKTKQIKTFFNTIEYIKNMLEMKSKFNDFTIKKDY